MHAAHRTTSLSSLLCCVIALASPLVSPSRVAAIDTTWTGGSDALWNNSGNWDNGVPTSGVNAFLNGPATPNNVIALPGNATANQLTVTGSYYGLTTGTLTLSDQLYVYGQNSRLDLDSGVSVSSPNGSIGVSAGDTNNTLNVSASLSFAGTLNVGYEGTANSLSVLTGGTTTANAVWIGGVATSATNTVTVAGGTLVATSSLVVGYAGDNNQFTNAGGSVTSGAIILGYDVGSDNNSAATVNGGLWTNAGSLTVGLSGTGNQFFVGDQMAPSSGSTLTVTGSASDVIIGANVGANGNAFLVLESSTFSSQATLVIGQSGTGNAFVVAQGSTVTSNNVRIGLNAGSVGNQALADGAGTTWDIAGKLRVGSDGDDNSLAVTDGAAVTVGSDIFVGGTSAASTVSGNTISVSGSGSTLSITSTTADLVISYGSGTNNRVVVSDGGTLNVSSIKLGPYGTLQIGSGTAAGTVSSAAIIDAAFGGGTVSFNHNASNYVFANSMTGSLGVVQEGTGRTVLTGSSPYTGNTMVTSGTLALQAIANNIASSGTIAVGSGATFDVSGVSGGFALASGQTLAGTGLISGTTAVALGATLSPGLSGIGTLTLANDLSILGTLAIELSGSANDLLDASASPLSLGAASILDFTTLGSLTGSAYIFAKYLTLSGTFDTVNLLPSGYTLDYNYLSGNQIALVTVPEPSAMALAAIAVAGMAFRYRNRRRPRGDDREHVA
jgi:T5SS/PEP-CTERM-associated repeat protein/autotransporter-associated beta strand protein